MPNIRRTFVKGVMNKDVDERLLDDGYFRHAENIVINTSEGSDVGAIEKCLSNKQLTFLDLGSNVETVGCYSDESKNKLYWWVISNRGCYVLEYNFNSKTLTRLLTDERSSNTRVLKFKRNTYITGIGKIISEDTSKDMLLWTDNNMEVCCINIERVKSFFYNAFQKEDIYLIKKPPTKAPRIQKTFDRLSSNNIEEKFISFSYRYKYLDGEFSAMAPFTECAFEPRDLEIDFSTQDNLSMINKFNSIKIFFNTGDHRVKEIQVLAKESNSNNVYIVETFNKKKESIGNNQEKSLSYSNNKLYKVLPEKDFFKQYDNVPRKAKALDIIGNRVVLGNYTEGYNVKDNQGKDINIDFRLSSNSVEIDKTLIISVNSGTQQLKLNNSLNLYKKGYGLKIFIDVLNDYYSEGNPNYGATLVSETFLFTLYKDFSSLYEIYNDSAFSEFVDSINYYIESNIENWKLSSTDTISEYPKVSFQFLGNNLLLNISHGWIAQGPGQGRLSTKFSEEAYFSVVEAGKGQSLKSNRDYEAAIVYSDEFGRCSTALTTVENSIYIDPSKSASINKLNIEVKNKAPYWATSYRFAVKSIPLNYSNIIVSRFYVEDDFVWCKLEGSSKDKVKDGDILILKKDTYAEATKIITIPVLEKKSQPKDFIQGNKDASGNDIIEEAGTYIRIKADGFVMNENNYKIYQDSKSDTRKSRGHFPDVTLVLPIESNWVGLELSEGSSVYLWMYSRNHLDAGWQENTFEKEWLINKENYNLQKWYEEYIDGKDLWGNIGNDSQNYRGKVRKVNVGGKDGLYIDGTHSASSGGRRGYLDAKMVVRTNTGYYIFETEEKKNLDTGIFYKSSQSFDIINGLHQGNISNQTSVSSAKIELDFFNCFAFGNGLESYQIKDKFNANALNIDLQPTSTSEEDYSEVTRYSDLTYSEAFVESTGFNGISSFNQTLINWKELDKGNGAIQKIVAREGNLLVYQTDKVSQVMYGKDVMYNADGTSNVAKVPYVLGESVPYSGEYGMSHPESFEKEGNRCYWVDAKRGQTLRLSTNGISPITYGLEGWFRDNLTNKQAAKIIGGYDPYTKLYNLTIGDPPNYISQIVSGSELARYQVSDEFVFELALPRRVGQTIFEYNITEGRATVSATYAGREYVESNVTGVGQLVINVDETETAAIQTTVVPTTATATYSIRSFAPEGIEQRITFITVSNDMVYGLNVNQSISINSGPEFFDQLLIEDNNVNQFSEETGIQGEGKFPKKLDTITLRSYSESDIADLSIGYVISDENYTESDLPKIISQVVPLKTTNGKEIEGSFDFTSEGNIYVVYNYGSYNPDYEKVLPPSYFELAHGADKSSIDVKFKNEQDNYIVKGNEISYKSSKETQWSEGIFIPFVDNTEQTYNIPDLSNGVEYEVRIRTIGNDNSTSDYLIEMIAL
ncbi:fibronectin type III domain-containing protein [Myroides odoratus]|nr:fibronectin type III domain-containing protein [Myroides odoratus]WQD58855.1 fibronectin type III domain-containing protein [Myroides odoratus]